MSLLELFMTKYIETQKVECVGFWLYVHVSNNKASKTNFRSLAVRWKLLFHYCNRKRNISLENWTMCALPAESVSGQEGRQQGRMQEFIFRSRNKSHSLQTKINIFRLTAHSRKLIRLCNHQQLKKPHTAAERK